MNILSRIWSDLSTPEAGDTWYHWSVIAIGHVMLGALAFDLLRTWFEWTPAQLDVLRACIPAVYFVGKEAPDMMFRGGTWQDAIHDTSFVFLGTLYGVYLWPLLVFAVVAAGAITWLIRRGV